MRLYDAVGDRAALAPLDRRQLRRLERRQRRRATAPPICIAIATAVRLDGNWKDANDVLRDAVRADPRATAANLDWGDVLLEKHNAADAEAAFRDVLKVDPDNPDAHVGLAARRRRRSLRRGADRARASATRAGGQPGPRGRAGAAGGARARRRGLAGARRADVAAIRRTNPRDAGAARVAAAAALLLDDRAGYERARDRRSGGATRTTAPSSPSWPRR